MSDEEGLSEESSVSEENTVLPKTSCFTQKNLSDFQQKTKSLNTSSVHCLTAQSLNQLKKVKKSQLIHFAINAFMFLTEQFQFAKNNAPHFAKSPPVLCPPQSFKLHCFHCILQIKSSKIVFLSLSERNQLTKFHFGGNVSSCWFMRREIPMLCPLTLPKK